MIHHKTRAWLAGVGYLICVLAMLWPGALIANRIEPMLLGLPFIFFWYVAWVFLLFLGLVMLYRSEYGGQR